MKRIILILIVAIIFIIYLITADRKVYYLTLGDELSISSDDKGNKGYSYNLNEYLNNKNKLEIFINDFSKINNRITDVINEINGNIKINHNGKNISIKNALIKTDLLTLSIGMNDIISRINIKNINVSDNYDFLYDDIDEIVADLDNMMNLIRKYCKENIYFTGLYYPFRNQDQELLNIFLYANNKFRNISEKYNIKYIDIYNQFLENDNYLSSTNGLYPSYEGHKLIYDQIVIAINNSV